MSKSNIKPKSKINDAFVSQIVVLKSLSFDGKASKHLQIAEIAENSGLADEREVQRALYILEGQKLVSPYPAGDFTSKLWHITQDGMRALETISANS